MSRKCQVLGKRFAGGRTYQYRGIAKRKKGIGINITGSSKRQHRINLFTQRFWSAEEKRFISVKLTAHAMRVIDKVGFDAVRKRMRLQALAG